jgi:hypothetical protein
MGRGKHIDHILNTWHYDPTSVSARICPGSDGRDILQMRVDMGLLQMEVDGRPEGERPHGYETCLDYLLGLVVHQGDDFLMSEEQCLEVDREFVQFYHRRVCWLKLQEYRAAAQDADHTLALMDFCARYAPDESWVLSHEQYRPFVLFHRIQAAALADLNEDRPEAAVQEINRGLQRVRDFFDRHEAGDRFDDDELVQRLVQLRETLREQYRVGRTLQEQLAEAVAQEQYELAAQLRDELRRRE